MVNKNKAIFFDRDGVLNKTLLKNGKPYAPRNIKDFKIISDAYSILSYLKSLNYLMFVVTNQPDVGNGYMDKIIVEEMHEMILDQLPIQEIFTCYHSQKDNCSCRKPKTGMLEKAHKKFNLNIKDCFIVGDRFSDIEAGQKFKFQTVMIGTGYGEKPLAKPDFNIDKLEDLRSIIF
jgi:D-glycero-D-manno-heptose 1,7-bisphosphate phosphatase